MKTQIKIRDGISNVRNLRADLLTAAYEFIEHQAGTALLLRNCRLSPERVIEERRLFAMVAPEAAAHISILAPNQDGEVVLPPHLVQEGVAQEIGKSPVKSKRAPGVGPHNIQSILLLNWLDDLGPQTVKSIGEASGTSYPTTAAALRSLAAQDLLITGKDRRVSLKYFPVQQWRKWIASGFGHRKSARFIDRSNQPRPPSSLLQRLLHLNRNDIAVSGIEGARLHYPDLDLSGALRLDLVLHGDPKSDLAFVNRLDPALEPLDNPYRKADLVVHFLDRPQTRFEQRGGLLVADPLECLADLYDLRLDQQADQMLKFLSERRNRSNHA